MDITSYLRELLTHFKDGRVKNIISLISGVVLSRSLKLFSLAKDKRQYDRFKGLLNGNQVNTLSSAYGTPHSTVDGYFAKFFSNFIVHQ